MSRTAANEAAPFFSYSLKLNIMANVEFRRCNLTYTKTNQIITANFKYVGEGSTHGCTVELLEDVFAKNAGYPDIKEGDLVYKSGDRIYVNHIKQLEGYKVISRK